MFALCVLALPAAAAQCDPTFSGNAIDLHDMRAKNTPKRQGFRDIGFTPGYSIVIPSNLPTVSLDNITSVNNFGCNTDITNAYVFKLRLMRGDTSRIYIHSKNNVGSWQTRAIHRLCS